MLFDTRYFTANYACSSKLILDDYIEVIEVVKVLVKICDKMQLIPKIGAGFFHSRAPLNFRLPSPFLIMVLFVPY